MTRLVPMSMSRSVSGFEREKIDEKIFRESSCSTASGFVAP